MKARIYKNRLTGGWVLNRNGAYHGFMSFADTVYALCTPRMELIPMTTGQILLSLGLTHEVAGV